MNYELSMLCPECNQKLLPISLKNQTGEIVLDYCPSCAGVWSDRGEINFLSKNELLPLNNVLPQNPKDTKANYQFLSCPKDKSPLRFFKRESIPQFLTVLRCNLCSGIWFPKKAVIEFKNAQEAKLNYFKKWQIPLPSVYAVLLPIFLLIILGTGLFLSVSSVKKGTDVRIKAKEQITQPLALLIENDSVLIGFSTKELTAGKIRYWINRNKIQEENLSLVSKANHSIILKGLEKNTNYYYQIIITDPIPYTSPVFTFSTKPKMELK